MALIAKLGADSGEFTAKMQQAQGTLGDLGAEVKKLALQFAGLYTAKEAANALKEFVIEGFEAIDVNAKLARQLGTTYNSLRAAQVATDMAGVSNEMFAQSAQKLNVTLGQAQLGVTKASDAMKMLGLDAQALSKMDVNERFAAIADRVREMGLSTSQTSALMRELGIKGGEMVDMLRQGGQAFRDGAKDVHDFGLELSEIDTLQVEAANDAISRTHLVLEGVRNQMVVALAPIVEAMAKKFTDLAKENGGWGNVAVMAIDAVVSGIGFLADMVRGLEVAWLGMKLVGTGAFAAIVTAMELVASFGAALIDGLTSDVNTVIRGIQSLGIAVQEIPSAQDSEFMQSFHQFGEDVRNTVGMVRDDLQALALQKMPGTAIREWVDDAKLKAKELAQVTKDAMNPSSGAEGGALQDPKALEQQNKEIAQLMEHVRKKLETVVNGNLTEQEALAHHFAEQQQIITDAQTLGLISDEQAYAARMAAQNKYLLASNKAWQQSLTAQEKFNAMTWQNKLKTTVGTMEQMTAGVAGQSKTMFEIHKAAALATAVAELPSSVLQSFHNGGGYPWGLIPAGIMAAVGAQNIAAIASSSFNGRSGSTSSSASTGSGGGAAAPAAAQAAPQQSSMMVVQGVSPDSFFTGKQLRTLAMQLSEFSRDGGTVVFE